MYIYVTNDVTIYGERNQMISFMHKIFINEAGKELTNKDDEIMS